MPRLFVCRTCTVMEKLPDYKGPVEDDQLLEYVVRNHIGHMGDLFNIDQEVYDNLAQRTAIEKEIWKNQEEMPATRDTFKEDAGVCFNRHGRPKQGCIDFHDDRKRLGNPSKHPGAKRIYLCDFCLSGDTEVITRDGVQRIADVVGFVELVVPSANRWGENTTRGSFRRVEVRSFGVQPLMEVRLQRGRAVRSVYATAEHRWMTAAGVVEMTHRLQPGLKLKPLKLTPARGKEQIVPFAVAQGFVFGDGSCGKGDHRPATVTFHGEKDKALLPFFALHEPQTLTMNGKRCWHVNGLPRFWKQLPPLNESRSFLFSWLAGYFAADGTVDKRGSASISSADRTHLEFVRSLAAVCGVGTGTLTTKYREGFVGREKSALHTLSIMIEDLPDWFWVIDEHRRRAQRRLDVPSYATRKQRNWRVVSVEVTDRVEEVFCAVVPGVEAFALADDLMTMNCPVSTWVTTEIRHKRGAYKE